MKQTGSALVVLALLAAMGARSEGTQDTDPGGNRFLLVLETSTASSRLTHGGRQAAFDLIFTGIHGQMREGDTFGVWTYNEEIFPGRYPLQTWTPTNNLELATQMGRFLKEQAYEKKGRLEPLVKTVLALVSGIKDVNVFVISDPGTRFGETALGQAFNTEFAKTARLAREAKEPVITTFVGRNGSISNWFVTVAGQPFRLPAIAIPPPPPRLVQTAPADVKPSRPPAARPPRPPIVMSGPNPKLGTVLSTVGEVRYVSSVRTNSLSDASVPVERIANSTATASVEPLKPKPPEIPKSLPITQPPLAPSRVAQSPVPTAPVRPPESVSTAAPPVKNPAAQPAPTVAQVPPPVAPPVPTPAVTVAPAAAAIAPVAAAAGPSLLAEPTKVKARELTSQSASAPETNQPSTLAAVATRRVESLGAVVMGIIIGVLLLALVLFLQRFRRASQSSFISRSMDSQ